MSLSYDELEVIPESQRHRRVRRIPDKDKIIVDIYEQVAGNDGVVDVYELQRLLQTCFRRELGEYLFNLETCRSLLILYDTDASCCVEFDEFYKLWKDLKLWYGIFKKYDTDRSFDMDKRELRGALMDMPHFTVTQRTIDIYSRRFANKNNCINLDDFIQIIARTKCLERSFERQLARSGSLGRKPEAKFTVEAYLEAVLIS